MGSVGPPLVTTTRSAPSTVMPCGPMALVLPGVLAYEARPSTSRDWRPHRSILVTAPVAPMHAGPSPPTKHGPVPPRPASATNRSPRDPNARCRGLSSPDATMSTLVVAAAAGAIPSARSNTMARTRNARITPPPSRCRRGDTLHSRQNGSTPCRSTLERPGVFDHGPRLAPIRHGGPSGAGSRCRAPCRSCPPGWQRSAHPSSDRCAAIPAHATPDVGRRSALGAAAPHTRAGGAG